jgi:hypothetical protein
MDSLLMDLADHYLTFFLHAIALGAVDMADCLAKNVCIISGRLKTSCTLKDVRRMGISV